MTVRSRQVGDSLQVTLGPSLLQQVSFDPQTPLEARVVDGRIVLEPASTLPWAGDADEDWPESLGTDRDVALDDVTTPTASAVIDAQLRSHFEAILGS
jgi:antitoxin component of MazEF toxin-antitoxin module